MRISDDEFDAAVAEALDGVPERFKAVAAQHRHHRGRRADGPRARHQWPTRAASCWDCIRACRCRSAPTGYSGVLPDIITIFKGPHERVCGSRAQLVGQIRKTVLHEIGHYFGFDDDYLHAHGY